MTIKEHALFKEVVSKSIETILIQYDKYPSTSHIKSTHKFCTFLPFYERTRLRKRTSMTTTEFYNLGIKKLKNASLSIDTVIAYENTDTYKALLGFVYMYKRTAKSVCNVIAELLGYNSNYIRQVISEYVHSSSSFLRSIAELYGMSFESLVSIGNIVHDADFVNLDKKIISLNIDIDFKNAKICAIPFAPTLGIDFSDQHNIAILLGSAVNSIINSRKLPYKSMYKLLDMSYTTFMRLSNFEKFPNNVTTYNTHIKVSNKLDISLYDIYNIGMSNYYTTMDTSILNSTSNIIENKRKIVSVFKELLSLDMKRPLKTLLVETTDIDFPQLSRITSINVIPSMHILEKIAFAFNVSCNEFLTIYHLPDEERKQRLLEILNSDCPITTHYNTLRVLAHNKRDSIINIFKRLSSMYSEKSIRLWTNKAGISYSCAHKIRSSSTTPSEKTISKLATSLKFTVEELLSIGNSLNDPHIKIEDPRFSILIPQ